MAIAPKRIVPPTATKPPSPSQRAAPNLTRLVAAYRARPLGLTFKQWLAAAIAYTAAAHGPALKTGVLVPGQTQDNAPPSAITPLIPGSPVAAAAAAAAIAAAKAAGAASSGSDPWQPSDDALVETFNPTMAIVIVLAAVAGLATTAEAGVELGLLFMEWMTEQDIAPPVDYNPPDGGVGLTPPDPPGSPGDNGPTDDGPTDGGVSDGGDGGDGGGGGEAPGDPDKRQKEQDKDPLK